MVSGNLAGSGNGGVCFCKEGEKLEHISAVCLDSQGVFVKLVDELRKRLRQGELCRCLCLCHGLTVAALLLCVKQAIGENPVPITRSAW